MSYYYEVYIPNETEPRIYSAVRKLRGLPEGTTIWRASEDDRYPVPVANGKAVVPSKRRAIKVLHADVAICEDCKKNPALEGCSVCAECGL